MNKIDFDGIIKFITEECLKLKKKYITENFNIDYICIFSQNQEEYEAFLNYVSSIGKIADSTKTGPVFKFDIPQKTIIGYPKVIKIRTPDKTRSQRGDVDFTTNYEEFKRKYLDNNRFKLIEREKFEMIELRDEKFDVLVYFSSIPPSKILGIT